MPHKQQFLIVLNEVAAKEDKSGRMHRMLECKCLRCSTVVLVRRTQFLSNKTRSCGCLHADVVRTHGLTNTPEYRVWAEMKQRCHNEKNKGYRDYGARGIFVCEKWFDSFERFYSDMGPRPTPNHSIERVDNNKGYYPGNCIWATVKTQVGNTRRNRVIEFRGERLPLFVWAARCGLSQNGLRKRFVLGWNMHDALTKPVLKRHAT